MSGLRAFVVPLLAVACGGGSPPAPMGPQAPSPAATSGGPTAAEILAKLGTCRQVSNGLYRTDAGTSPTIPVCASNGGYWWKADMDIDCDGVRGAQCNENTDPTYLPETALETSSGGFFDAATMPYVVLPSPSGRWSFEGADIALGAVVAVVFAGRVEYGVFADTGPPEIIGEASYAMARRLGVNPDPAVGGTDGEVAYLVFPRSRVSPVESHDDAVRQGQGLARQFITAN